MSEKESKRTDDLESFDEYIYGAIDKNEFKQRMSDSFPATYLTVISIIQGVALGILAQNTFGYFNSLEVVNTAEIVSSIPYACLSFITIAIVSFEYNWFVGIYRWSPKFLDTFIPFSLGITEIAPLFFFTNPKLWWIFTTVFVATGAISFTNTIVNCKPDMFKEIEIYKMVKKDASLDRILVLALLPFFVIISSFHGHSFKIYHWFWYEILGFILYLIFMIALITKDQKFIRNLHHSFRLKS